MCPELRDMSIALVIWFFKKTKNFWGDFFWALTINFFLFSGTRAVFFPCGSLFVAVYCLLAKAVSLEGCFLAFFVLAFHLRAF